MKIKVYKKIYSATLKPYAVIAVKDSIIETIFNIARCITFRNRLREIGFTFFNSDCDCDSMSKSVSIEEVKSTIAEVNDTYNKVCEAYKNL